MELARRRSTFVYTAIWGGLAHALFPCPKLEEAQVRASSIVKRALTQQRMDPSKAPYEILKSFFSTTSGWPWGL